MLLKPSGYLPLSIAVLLLILPLILEALQPYLLHATILLLLFAMLAVAWNILGGYCGQISLGHSVFFGIGSYTTIMLLLAMNMSPWLGLIIGVIFSVLASILLGYPTFRLRGPYFSLATLAMGEIMRRVFLYFRGHTGGAIGLIVPFLRTDSLLYFQFLTKTPYYYIALVFLATAIYTTRRIEESKLGYYLKAIREDEDAAEAMGIDVTKYKLKAIMISALFTSIGGSFYVQFIRFLDPESAFSLEFSIDIAIMAIIGGMGTVWGPVLGAALLTPIIEITRSLLGGTYLGAHLILFGAILIAIVIMVPQGLVVRFQGSFQSILGQHSADES